MALVIIKKKNKEKILSQKEKSFACQQNMETDSFF
jgi:hypothetical protein